MPKGNRLMKEAGTRYGFAVLDARYLWLDRERAVYRYDVRSTENMGKSGATRATFDANTGALKSLVTSTTEASRPVITRWFIWLHMRKSSNSAGQQGNLEAAAVTLTRARSPR